eukprot:TRINITY_DN3861_c0_g1_i2.p1 TRINITY_DN3861_c0_g1~~TRINITY_DN3861_c0_g1_i2.p1  ORF type:complete len:179 (-),score=41.97 TRINITY_DN3861_c0_g1_i2:137-673(-)
MSRTVGILVAILGLVSVANCLNQTLSWNLGSYYPNVQINTGDFVTWFSNDSLAHTVSFSSKPSTSQIANSVPFTNTSYTLQFNQQGVYNFFCEIHTAALMNGTITVTQKNSGTSTTGSTSTSTTGTGTGSTSTGHGTNTHDPNSPLYPFFATTSLGASLVPKVTLVVLLALFGFIFVF